MNGREKRFVRAVQRLGAKQFVNFLRAVRADRCTAVQLINEAFGGGNSLQSTFATGDEFGYSLSVKRLGKGAFLIAFGCRRGRLSAMVANGRSSSGGHGEVTSAESKVAWIS